MPSPRDTLDEDILKLLREDGRMSNVEVGRRLSVSEATVRKRVARLLEAEDVRVVAITGQPTEKPLRMLFMVDTRPGGRRALTAWVTLQAGVEQVTVTTGDYGFLIHAQFANEADALAFSDSLESSRWVERVSTRVVLATHLGEAAERHQHVTELGPSVQEAFATLHVGFGVDRVALHLIEDGAPVYVDSQNLSTEYLLDSTHSVVQHAESPVLRAAKRGELVVVEDVRSEPSMAHMREVAAHEDLGALVAVPIPGRNDAPVAVLTAYFDVPRKLRATEIAELQQAAVASVGPAVCDYLAGIATQARSAPKVAP